MLVLGIRKARILSDGIRVDWRLPGEEPLLWAADVVAGATTWWLDGQPAGFDILAHRIRLVCLD
ncbi:hypothetical protein Psi02_31050 [Planotetraspora silvatica]|uniref:Uncharacterized protein n=1 Tax=Planotetraspora silvatica TaxID=234614 RepID=A0A8J3UNV6_9ACTN|nr:hypothetical protein Psi02_31050 [Planotetraspora silvatica]